MQPVAHEGLAGGTLRLRDLIFVMREDQVLAAGMNVEGFAQLLHAHGRALDVPAGTAFTPGRLPHGAGRAIRILGGFPEREIAGVIFLVFVRVDGAAIPCGQAGPAAHVLQVDARQPAIGRQGRNRKVHRAIADVGVAALDEARDQLDHGGDILGGAGINIRAANAERIEVRQEGLDHGRGDAANGDATLMRRSDDLVLDIGQVHDEADIERLPFEIAVQQVVEDKRAVIADVRRPVYGRAAGVNTYAFFAERRKGFDFAAERVVEAKRHVIPVAGATAQAFEHRPSRTSSAGTESRCLRRRSGS